MKRIIASIFFLFAATVVNSQSLSQVTFNAGTHLAYFSFLTDQDVLIRVSEQGNVIEWGTEVFSRYNNNASKLQPFMGRVDYYGPESDSVFRGKVKSIGTCTFTYYGGYETAEKIGKIKTIGTLILDYYSNYEDKSLQGKLKFAGSLAIAYYASYEEESLRGKLKSVGNSPITYYSIFEDKLNQGKIKSIGPVSYSWYSQYDRSEFRGGLKKGLQRQNINGITYILWAY